MKKKNEKPGDKKNRKKKGGNKIKQKKRFSAWKVTLLAAIITFVTGALAWMQLLNYEEGVLQIYAEQQDAYVQLVLDQINLLDNRSDEEIVSNILGTMDASTNKYWTLSNEEALVFVKDVLETNRYKGFTTSTYYGTMSAQNFIDSLEVNRVNHSFIRVEGQRYIASGVEFVYREQEHSICLLTNTNVVLDHNAYLSAKINVSVLAITFLVIFLITAGVLAKMNEKRNKENEKLSGENGELRNTIQRLSDELSKDELYDTKNVAFNEKMLRPALEKVEARNAWPVTFLLVYCETEEIVGKVLENGRTMMDSHFLRITLRRNYILVISVKGEKEADKTAVRMMLTKGARLVSVVTYEERPWDPLTECCQKFLKQVMKNGK